jgi:hypothetical protein
MTKRTVNSAAEPANILKFEIKSSATGGLADVKGGVVHLAYFESILENTIRVTATIIDSGNALPDASNPGEMVSVLRGLKLSGFEEVKLIFTDNQDPPFKMEFEKLRIAKIRNIYSHTQKTSYTIDLVSNEFCTNEEEPNLVYKRYDGEISSSVKKIIKENLKTNKDVEADLTNNTYNFTGNAKKPMKLCTELAKYCVPDGIPNARGKIAGYLFFETYDGYKFKSIDKLFQGTYKKYIYNLTVGEVPSGYDGKILEYHSDKTIDVQQRLLSGAYGTKLEGFDPYQDKFGFSKVNQDQQPELGGNTSPFIPSEFSKISRKSQRRLDVGELPSGSTSEQQLKNAFDENLNAGITVAQSAMRYNQLFNIILTITVAGDFTFRAGSLIYCDFPGTSPKNNPRPDPEISGIYMISDVCHYIEPKRTFTKMQLVRGSFGRI